MDLFIDVSTIKRFARNVLLTLLLLLTILATGCSDSNHSSSEPTTVFATVVTPLTVEEIDAWLADFVARTEQIRVQVTTSQLPDWEHDLTPLYDLFVELSDALQYSEQLMIRSADPAVRARGYVGYQQFPQLTASLTMAADLKQVVENALNRLTPTTPRQQDTADYLSDVFSSDYSPAQQAERLEVNERLTNVSYEYYNNTISKSASAIFTSEEFGCLPEKIRSQIPTDSSGNFIFNAHSPLYFTLARSCLDETVRERLHAVWTSSAAAENSLLWPTIQRQRLAYAELSGYDDFASMRLSNSMLPSSASVRALIDEVDAITTPAFERLQQRYKMAQASEEGLIPETFFGWNRDRYTTTVNLQFLDSSYVDSNLLTFPDTFDRMLYLVGKIVGLSFVKVGYLENSWNPDVVEYRVYDQKNNDPVATLLVDPYQVDGTSSGATLNPFMSSRQLDSGEKQVPVVILNSNLSKPISGTAYMSPANYVTFGHELGHVLHFMLRLAPPSTYQSDFVEIPSMFCEAVVQHPEFLKAVLSPNPDESLEQLPDDFVTNWRYYQDSPVGICENERFLLAQSATIIDLTAWQGGIPTDLAEVAKNNLEQYYLPYSSDSQPFYDITPFIKPVTDTHFYMYALAQVIATDILGVFEASPESIFDQQLGERYRSYILKNSSPDSEAAITGFLGREWNYDAYQNWFEEKTQDL